MNKNSDQISNGKVSFWDPVLTQRGPPGDLGGVIKQTTKKQTKGIKSWVNERVEEQRRHALAAGRRPDLERI